MIGYSFFMTEKIARLLILKLPFLCFFGSSYCQQTLYLKHQQQYAIMWYSRSLVSFLHSFCILVKGLSLLFNYASKFSGK